jgi:hypothetical protein
MKFTAHAILDFTSAEHHATAHHTVDLDSLVNVEADRMLKGIMTAETFGEREW